MRAVLSEVGRVVIFTAVCMSVFGAGYHAMVWSAGRLLFAHQADGSLIRRPDGTITGSSLIGQPFAGAAYLHPRPSAVSYNAAATGGSNEAASNPAHVDAVAARVAAVVALERIAASDVPVELVTASGSGLDPHLSLPAAAIQVPRIARARGASEAQVKNILSRITEPPWLGVFGPARVNVLEFNLALDDAFGQGAARE